MTAIKQTSRRGRPAKTFDNYAVREWLLSYENWWEFRRTNARAEDVFIGAVRARTEGDTRRDLSPRRLFKTLRGLDTITTADVAEVLACARQTAEVYAAAARIASRALEPLADPGAVTAANDAFYDQFCDEF